MSQSSWLGREVIFLLLALRRVARLAQTVGTEYMAFQQCLADTNFAFDKCKTHKEAFHAAFAAANETKTA